MLQVEKSTDARFRLGGEFYAENTQSIFVECMEYLDKDAQKKQRKR